MTDHLPAWVAIAISTAAIVISVASVVLSMLTERRYRRNRR